MALGLGCRVEIEIIENGGCGCRVWRPDEKRVGRFDCGYQYVSVDVDEDEEDANDDDLRRGID